MGITNWLGIGKDIAAPIKAVGDLYTTDKARTEAEKDYEEVKQKTTLAQLSNNAIMAASKHFFSSGWQPMTGWTAGFLVLVYYLPQLLIIIYVWGGNCIDTGTISPFPMKPDDILNLVYLLFGFGVHHIAKNKL